MDELISRQAVIKAFSEWRDDDDRDLWQVIDSVPAAEPCEDAVSRKAVQYLLAHFVDEDKYVDACDGLKHLPPVLPKQKWIPMTERLPEVKQKVLVQYADGNMMTKRCNDAGHLQCFYANAVAWRPVPEPWEGDAE